MNKMLRDYQQEMMDRLEEAWTRYRSVMVQMPTGTGKTLLMAEVIRKTLPRPRSVREGSGVLIVTHRRELVEQIKGSLPPAPPEGKGDGPEVIVTSIQKLSRTDSPSVPLGKQGAWKYGKVTPHGDVFEGKTINGQQTFWDGVGLRYYNTLPEFVRIGGVEMVCRNGKYLLRRQQGSQGEPVGEDGLCRPGLRQKDKPCRRLSPGLTTVDDARGTRPTRHESRDCHCCSPGSHAFSRVFGKGQRKNLVVFAFLCIFARYKQDHQ